MQSAIQKRRGRKFQMTKDRIRQYLRLHAEDFSDVELSEFFGVDKCTLQRIRRRYRAELDEIKKEAILDLARELNIAVTQRMKQKAEVRGWMLDVIRQAREGGAEVPLDIAIKEFRRYDAALGSELAPWEKDIEKAENVNQFNILLQKITVGANEPAEEIIDGDWATGTDAGGG